MLCDEQSALASLTRALPASDRGGARASAVQPQALRAAVRALRTLESSLDFQAELLASQRAVAASTGYSSANFAYGSTPLHSWLALFDSAPLRTARAEAPADGLRYVVLGSSLGSLVMYGACVHGFRSRGVEIMPLLASRATQLAARAGVYGASFECADMLRVDLSASDVVLLASQCWDAALLARVQAKLLDELRVGALVLDYTAALGETAGETAGEDAGEAAGETTRPSVSSGGEPPAMATHAPPQPRRAFALECTIRAPVSWDETHCFWCWRVVLANS